MKNLCVNALKYVSIISFPIAVGTTLLADKIIILVYGQEYANSSIALAILIWSIIPTFMHFVLGLFVVSTNNEVRGMINTGSCAALNVILNLFLIPKYGLVGSAIATIVTEVFLVIMNYGVLVKVFREFNIVKIVYKPLIASLGMGVIFFIRDLNLLLVIFIGAIAYLTILLLIRGFDKKDKERVLNIVRRRLQYENK
jgi:O-antigen/teichoic acid export membrane protein